MLFAYVDESYCEDWFYMAAIVGTGEQIEALMHELDRLMEKVSVQHGLDPATEFHGYELFQGKGPWREIESIGDRVAIGKRVARTVADSGVHILIRGLDRQAQRRRYREAYEPYPIVLGHLLKEIDKHGEQAGRLVEVICDEYHHHDRHRAALERAQKSGSLGYDSRKLRNIDGTLGYVSSAVSRPVQAADVVAYLVHREAARPNVSSAEKRARRALLGCLRPRVSHDYCWSP